MPDIDELAARAAKSDQRRAASAMPPTVQLTVINAQQHHQKGLVWCLLENRVVRCIVSPEYDLSGASAAIGKYILHALPMSGKREAGEYFAVGWAFNGNENSRIPALNVSYGAQTELTIASGVVRATKSYHSIDTEGDAGSDDLDTINGGIEGKVLIIRANNDARSVVCKNGSGNLKLAGSDFTLDNVFDTLSLIYNGTYWLETARSNNGS